MVHDIQIYSQKEVNVIFLQQVLISFKYYVEAFKFNNMRKYLGKKAILSSGYGMSS